MGLTCMQPRAVTVCEAKGYGHVAYGRVAEVSMGVSQKCKNHSDDPIQQWCKETHESANPIQCKIKYQCMLPTEACGLGQVMFGGGGGKLLDPRADTQRQRLWRIREAKIEEKHKAEARGAAAEAEKDKKKSPEPEPDEWGELKLEDADGDELKFEVQTDRFTSRLFTQCLRGGGKTKAVDGLSKKGKNKKQPKASLTQSSGVGKRGGVQHRAVADTAGLVREKKQHAQFSRNDSKRASTETHASLVSPPNNGAGGSPIAPSVVSDGAPPGPVAGLNNELGGTSAALPQNDAASALSSPDPSHPQDERFDSSLVEAEDAWLHRMGDEESVALDREEMRAQQQAREAAAAGEGAEAQAGEDSVGAAAGPSASSSGDGGYPAYVDWVQSADCPVNTTHMLIVERRHMLTFDPARFAHDHTLIFVVEFHKVSHTEMEIVGDYFYPSGNRCVNGTRLDCVGWAGWLLGWAAKQTSLAGDRKVYVTKPKLVTTKLESADHEQEPFVAKRPT